MSDLNEPVKAAYAVPPSVKIVYPDGLGRRGPSQPTNWFVFPGGEVGVKLPPPQAATATVEARLRDSRDVMELVMITDALRRQGVREIDLFMPYVPYGRQDRVCVNGEAFSLKAFAGIINLQGYRSVTVVDPHSDVTAAVLDNVKVVTQLDLVKASGLTFTDLVFEDMMFVSPDAGANKKTMALAAHFNQRRFARADKLRDLATGKILETVVYEDDFEGRTVIIADDICDGGRTFIDLAAVLHGKRAGRLVLFVTHGIFSRGIEPLFQSGFDSIWTTDSVCQIPPTGKFRVINLEAITL